MRRILALDGGGIRGIISLEILREVERLFREERGRGDLVLAEVFDLIAGTSTGAIIAACLSWGMTVDEIERLYVDEAAAMFAPAPWYQRWKFKYRSQAIGEMFQRRFQDASDGEGPAPSLLGTSRLRTTLLVVMRNASTGSPWPVTNHPDACYNNRSLPDCNLDIPLWKLLRASTAAPTFFPPEQIQIGPRSHVFVDGGITPYNNPALIAVLMATLPTYRIHWPAGRDKLHVLSIGTGRSRIRLPRKLADRINLLDQLGYIAPALISAASVEQDMLCRILGDCRYGHEIDSEVGDLAEASLLSPAEQKFTYARYDPPLDALAGDRIAVPLDDIRLIPDFMSLGRRYAAEHVRREHLHPVADL